MVLVILVNDHYKNAIPATPLLIPVDLRYYTGRAGLTVARRPRPGEPSKDLVSR